MALEVWLWVADCQAAPASTRKRCSLGLVGSCLTQPSAAGGWLPLTSMRAWQSLSQTDVDLLGVVSLCVYCLVASAQQHTCLMGTRVMVSA